MRLHIKSFERPSGFTLIELLVVIALIGIIAAIVMVSLDMSRNRGRDAAVKQNLANARAQAEIFFHDAGGTYRLSSLNNVCVNGTADTPAGLADFIAAVSKESSNVVCGVSVSSWAVEAELSDGSWYCIGSIGALVDGGNESGVSHADPECDADTSA